eukprot:1179093-Prorocentrum_minimum.AAC.4
METSKDSGHYHGRAGGAAEGHERADGLQEAREGRHHGGESVVRAAAAAKRQPHLQDGVQLLVHLPHQPHDGPCGRDRTVSVARSAPYFGYLASPAARWTSRTIGQPACVPFSLERQLDRTTPDVHGDGAHLLVRAHIYRFDMYTLNLSILPASPATFPATLKVAQPSMVMAPISWCAVSSGDPNSRSAHGGTQVVPRRNTLPRCADTTCAVLQRAGSRRLQ